MKKIFYMILFALVIANFCTAQIITFDKTLPSASAEQVFQTEDGGYLLNCQGITPPGKPSFIKTDSSGYIEWIKEYPSFFTRVKKTFGGGYIGIGNIQNSLYRDISLVKLNDQLDTVWIQTYGTIDQDESGQAVIQLPDSSFIISSLDNGTFFLRKTDAEGSLVWTKKILGLASMSPSYLVSLNNGNFIFGKSSVIIKMDSNADTVWIKSTTGLTNSDLTNDGYILFSSSSFTEKLDQNGNVIWHKDFSNGKSFTQLTNGNYVILKRNLAAPSSCEIVVTDTSGNILYSKSFENSGEYMTSTNDGGIVVCGSMKQAFNFYYAWLLKTDDSINYNAINLKEPLDGDKLNIFSAYPIIWRANNTIFFVKIDYSVDNQNSWNNIINYYPASADTFNWVLPNMPAGNLFIRISDSFNSNIYDRSDPPQTAINYQAADYIAANEIFMWIGNNGMGSHDPRTDGSGFYWPGGEDATISAIFEDGLVWGGKVNGEIRVNGSTYRYGLTPGYILPSGFPSDPFEVKSKIFKLKKNWQYLPPGAERDRYEFDFLNWPVDVGAPWEDKNGDGVYTQGIDIPKIFGDETLFFIANDLDTANTQYTYGSNPIGLEFQVTTFGYDSELLKDVVFKKYKVINKSSNTITDMYLSYWTDDDLGFAGDDFVGCDTSLNLGYTYNADNNDQDYYGTPPPAVGHLIVQPPIIQAQSTDSARYGDGWRKGYKNLQINSFVFNIGGLSGMFADPNLGEYSGTLEFYNYMQGLLGDGSPIIDPTTGLTVHFILTGNPEAGTGWYEGVGWPGGPRAGDRRFLITAGKFDMAPSDTQEVTIAILMKKGNNNLNSITEIRNYASLIQNWYDNDFVVDIKDDGQIIPLEFSLSQNYPNPFNPSTTISWQSPVSSRQTLKVYDVLGNEVATLLDEFKSAGSYEVNFDASKLSSGVYFYRLNAGSFVETKKMILLR